jgi:hypothetical protein
MRVSIGTKRDTEPFDPNKPTEMAKGAIASRAYNKLVRKMRREREQPWRAVARLAAPWRRERAVQLHAGEAQLFPLSFIVRADHHTHIHHAMLKHYGMAHESNTNNYTQADDGSHWEVYVGVCESGYTDVFKVPSRKHGADEALEPALRPRHEPLLWEGRPVDRIVGVPACAQVLDRYAVFSWNVLWSKEIREKDGSVAAAKREALGLQLAALEEVLPAQRVP